MDIVLNFNTPVQIGGTAMAAVTIRQPYLKDELLAAAQAKLATGTQLEVNRRLLAILTGLTFKALSFTRTAVIRVLEHAVDKRLLAVPPHKVDRQNGRIVITFDPPVEIGGAKIASATMREPVMEDELQAAAGTRSGTDQEAEARLIALLIDMPFDTLVEAESGTYRVFYREFLRFLESQPTAFVAPSSTSPSSATADSAGNPAAA